MINKRYIKLEVAVDHISVSLILFSGNEAIAHKQRCRPTPLGT